MEKIKHNSRAITKNKPFINQYNWKEISLPSHKKDWKKLESNNKSIAFNTLFVSYNSQEIRHAYKSKHDLKRKNQVIILMITDCKKWHYLAVSCCKKFVCMICRKGFKK